MNAGSTILAASLQKGLASIPVTETNITPNLDTDKAQSTPQIYRTFIIGGATIYDQALRTLPPLNRILLTRILEPSFDECDVFLPEFRSRVPQASINEDIGDAGKTQENAAMRAGTLAEWERADHGALIQWVGFDTPRGVNEEKGVKYEFQLWVRNGGSDTVNKEGSVS